LILRRQTPELRILQQNKPKKQRATHKVAGTGLGLRRSFSAFGGKQLFFALYADLARTILRFH
jgi:hypothetical protein